jgi:hypothetical protein
MRKKMSKEEQNQQPFAERRKQVIERRLGFDRRKGPGIRRAPERISAEEGSMTDEQFEFLMAIDNYKKQNQRPFPSWTEVLDIILAMGYRKVAEPSSIDSVRQQDSVMV